jgi:hypothetical protein
MNTEKHSAVEVCPDCDIAGCTHIRNRTGAFASRASKPVGVDKVVRAAQECAHQLREAMMHLTSQDRDFWQRGDNAIMQEFEEAISQVQQATGGGDEPASK